MKPKAHLRDFLLGRPLAIAALLSAPLARAQSTLTWDANAATASQTDGAGAWLGAAQWWTGSANITWTSGDSAIFGNNGAGGAVTLAEPTTVGSFTFNLFTGTYTLGTTGQAITLNNGITKKPGSTATIISPITVAAAQTWTNNSTIATGTAATGTLNATGGVILDHTLTINGTSITNFGGTANVISGTGGITKNGTGVLVLSGGGTTPVHTYSGTTTINGGVVRFQNPGNATGTGNLTINNGILEGYFGNAGSYLRDLGDGPNQIQIPGGTSGFAGQGATANTFQIGTALSNLEWGSVFFKPEVFVLQSGSANTNGKLVLNNGIDLGSVTRTIAVLGGDTTGGSTVTGAIIGTGAGLIKTGSGNLILTNADNTYDGPTTITGAIVPTVPANFSGAITLSGAGTLNTTSALTLNGGILQLINTTQLDRFADAARITSSGGAIIYANSSGANLYTETLGSLAVTAGTSNLVLSTNQAGDGSQTLTLGGLTRSGTAAVAFSAAATSPQASGDKNMIVVTGAGSSPFIGPWATTGTTAALQSDYAAYSSDHVVPANIGASAETTWSGPSNAFTMDSGTAAITLTADRNIAALRNIGGTPLTSVSITTEVITLTGHTFTNGNPVVFGTGAPGGLTGGTTYFVVGAAPDTFQVSATAGGAAINLTTVGTAPEVASLGTSQLTLASGANLGTTGILNGSTIPMVIAPGTGGTITLPTTTAAQLHVNSGRSAITINAPVTNNTGALTLVKNGSSSLILNGVNSYTGDTIINAGTLQIGTNPVTNGAVLNSGNYSGNITIGAGANLDFQTNADQELSGVISGDGNLLKRHIGTLTLSGNNTYTGTTTLGAITNSGSPVLVVSSFNSVGTPMPSSSLGRPTTVATGTILLGSNNSTPNPVIRYVGTGETTDRVINFLFNSSATRTLDASNPSGLLKFTSNFTANATTTGNITLQGSGNGELDGGLPFIFNNFIKSGDGTWSLGGPVGNIGTLTISGGKLLVNSTASTSGGVVNVSTNATLGGTGTLGGNTTIANNGQLEFNLKTAASSHDKLELTSGKTLTFSGDSTLTITSSGGASPGLYTLFTAPGGITGLVPAIVNLPVGWTADLPMISGNDLVLNITSTGGGGGSPYTTWSGGALFDADTNGDGVKNGLAFLLGAANPNANALALLPVPTSSGGNLVLTFPSLNAANRGTAVLSVEHSSSLGSPDPWTTVAVPEASAGAVNGVSFTVTSGSPTNAVMAVIQASEAATGKLFGRLKAVQNP